MKPYVAAPTPPMGWNSWDCFGAGVTEEALLANAAYMRDHLKSYGWQYIVCDIQWYEPNADSVHYHNFTELCMDAYSRLIPAENRFPSAAGGKGFAPLAEKIHAMGLKFGIHMMRGIPRQAVHRNTPLLGTDRTARQIAAPYSLCPWNTDMYGVACVPGAQEYYDSVFSLYASWGVDYVKIDDICNTEYKKDDPYSAAAEIEMIRRAINACGREMVLSLSPGPAQLTAAGHMAKNADLWRMTGDFWDEWPKLRGMFDYCERWYTHVGGGCWPDCDMLPLGHLHVNNPSERHYTRFTPSEQRLLMTLWCVFRSPLMFGGHMPDNDDFTLSLLQNSTAIAVNQRGSGARPMDTGCDHTRVWTAQCDGRRVLALFNLSDEKQTVRVPFDAGFRDFDDRRFWQNVWENTDISPLTLKNGVNLEQHSACLLIEYEQNG